MDNKMTHIPDEAVQAFIERYEIGCNHRYDENSIRAALTAALPHLQNGFEVKKLEWVDYPAGGFQALAAGLALYRVHANGDDWYMVHDHMGKGGKAAAQDDFERRVRECIVFKPVYVAAVRRQAFEEGFENGVEQSLDALNAHDDITRNEAEQAMRKCKPDYRALSHEIIDIASLPQGSSSE